MKSVATSKVTVPALLIHSHQDPAVPFTCLQALYDDLFGFKKPMQAVEGMDHSIVRDPKRQQGLIIPS
jgi:esterase/lipase